MAQVLFFAPDVAEAAQIRRIRSIRSVGHSVSAYAFRRQNMNKEFAPDWPTVLLGDTQNESFRTRAAQMVVGLSRVMKVPELARTSDVWIARNIDMALIAHAAR